MRHADPNRFVNRGQVLVALVNVSRLPNGSSQGDRARCGKKLQTNIGRILKDPPEPSGPTHRHAHH